MRTIPSLVLLAASAACFALPSSGAAQGRGGGRASSPEIVDFVDADRVEGAISGPDHERILSTTRGRHSTLIRPREHFRSEMLKSVETL